MSTKVKQGALSDIKIVEFGQYIPGPLLGMLLSDQGADVIKIERPGGDPGRKHEAFGTWNRGKRSIVLDLKTSNDLKIAQNICSQADVVIENYRPGVADRLGIGYEQLTLTNPGLIYCSLPGFGETSPYRNMQGWEQLVSSLTGVYNKVEGNEGPLYTQLPLASTFAAIVAAVSTTMAIIERDSSKQGQRIEVSLYSAMFTAIGRHLVQFHDNPPVNMREQLSLPMVRQYLCSDGRYVQNHGNYKRFVGQLMEAANHPSWEQDAVDAFGKILTRETYDQWLDRFTKLFLSRSSKDWEDSIAKAGGACTISKTIDEWLVHKHPNEGEMIVSVEDPVLGVMKQPGTQVKLRKTPGSITGPAPTLGADKDSILNELAKNPPKSSLLEHKIENTLDILNGIKVLDLCIVLAGPTCGRTLAEYGADVIKIDDPSRPYDITGNVDVNRGKKSILLDLKTKEGKEIFSNLVKDADVLVQNYRKGSLEKHGFGYEDLRKINPRLIYASLNAYGFDGPWADRPGWEQIAQATSGIQVRRGGRGEKPILLPYPANDYGTGMMGSYAVALALHERNKSGEGQQVDTGLCLTAGLLQSPFFLSYPGMNREELEGLGIKGENIFSRLYQSSDKWMFVRAETLEDFNRALTSTHDFSSIEELTNATLPISEPIVSYIETIFQSKPADYWIDSLVSEGVEVVLNTSLEEIQETQWVRDQGLIIKRELPDRGNVDHLGSTALLSRTPMAIGRPSPVLGADSISILTDLGYSKEEIETYIAADIVVTEEKSPIHRG
jgi:crotonobetainyl-CoA:carnitine CoA-transferase CaiB-like acyl-CoA transferase